MKTKVVYVVGPPFVGSTFLGALLSVHPQIEAGGELAMWARSWHRANPGRMCACGRLRIECPFWHDVQERWLDGLTPVAWQSYDVLQNRIESRAYPFRRAVNPGRSSSDFDEYRRMTAALYRSVSEVSGRPVVVDTSKRAPRASAISRVDELHTVVIHLVRNGLNFLDSSLRRRKRISPDDAHLQYRAFRLGRFWSHRNYTAERVMTLNRNGGVRLRYEDLVANPCEALESVGRALEIDMKPVQDHVRMGRPVSYRHLATGSRHRKLGAKPLHADFASPPDLDPRLTRAFRLGARLASRRYGYS
jgi:hypothetical protein